MEKIKFGFVKISNNTEVLEFKKEFLNSDGDDKFIQVIINGEDYIRLGYLYHRRILRETLDEFGLKYSTKLNRAGLEMPLAYGNNYGLMGAGKIKLVGDKLNFYDTSSDYFHDIKGTNLNHLVHIFGIDSITLGQSSREPSFFVKI